MLHRTAAVIATLMAAAATPALAQRQGVHVVSPLAGYRCMELNVPAADLEDLSRMPPVLSEPRPDSARIGIASATMIAPDPPRTVNGFAQVLHLDGREGWIESSKLKIWVRPQSPRATCTPARLSNGRIGFDFGPHR
jgi:hypothetical protein